MTTKREVKVEMFLQKLSQPLVFENVTSTFQKGDLFCIYLEDSNVVYKYPIHSIFRVKETYDYRRVKKARKK